MSDVTITHTATPHGGRYVAHVAGSTHTGYLAWEAAENGVRIAAHTVVPRAIGGRGVAARLVERLIEDARSEGFRIVPQCSYVAAAFERHPEWSDLRA